MATFTKDALYPGQWHLPDGSVFDCSPELCHQLGRRASDMLAAGLHIPVLWEHTLGDDPAERQAYAARHCLGFVAGAGMIGDDCLQAVVDVPIPSDAERLEAVRFVSPELDYDFVDGSGRLWDGPSITHLAVTPRPVQHLQQPFQAVRLSSLRVVRLSLGAFEPVRLGEGTVKDDDKGEGQGKGDGGSKGQDDPDAGDFGEGDDQSQGLEAGEVPPDDTAKLQSVLGALASVGLILPEDTTPENLLDRLHTSALTLKGADPMAQANDGQAVAGAGAAGTGAGAGGGGAQSPVMMSLQKRLTKAEAKLLQLERDKAQARLDTLRDSGHVPPALHGKLSADLKAVKLSLNADAVLAPNRVLAKIEAFEELAAAGGAPAVGPQRLSGGRPLEKPRPSNRPPVSEAEVNRTVDQIDVMMGRKKPS